MSRDIPITRPEEHVVIVTFATTPADQQQALEQIGAYVDRFLSRQPGFIVSQLHRGHDGNSLIHYARWQSEADFQAAGTKARLHPDLPALLAWSPVGRGYTVWQTYQGADDAGDCDA